MACRTSMRSLFLTTEPWCLAHRSFISASRNPLMTTSSLPKPDSGFLGLRIFISVGRFIASAARIMTAPRFLGTNKVLLKRPFSRQSLYPRLKGESDRLLMWLLEELLPMMQRMNGSSWIRRLILTQQLRGFTAIGTGGDDFVQSMVVAVESVIQQPIPEGRITQKVSSRGKYVSVNIGPVRVLSSEQVQAVYNAMRRDDRMKYFL
ncbi:unnamed protein product [Rhodiola kirilowii]